MPESVAAAQPPALIERSMPLAQLQHWLRVLAEPGAGGRCLLLQGEAGIGKTSLLRAGRAAAPPRLDWLMGWCEPLLSPTPLGPLLDMLDGLPPALASMVSRGQRVQEVMPELLAWLRALHRPLVLVVDDAQWADHASLDLLRFLGRRIEGLPLGLVLSYRDDELPPSHPLRAVVGGLPPAATLRLGLARLSARGVEQAARAAGRPARGLHKLTQGNPFYLAELLAAPAESLPASVRDAVLARAQRLSPAARALLALASVSPVPLERTTLASFGDPAEGALPECLAGGLLVDEAGAIAFRHELARRAVESALADSQRRALHHRLLQALPEASATRRVHHAEGAGLDSEVQRLAPLAAADAARAAAHRQAAALYTLALARGSRHGPADEAGRAALLGACAEQHELIAELDTARQLREQALALQRAQGDRAGEGLSLCGLARLHWLHGDIAAGKRTAAEAIEVLSAEEHPRELGMAYAVMAQLHLLDATHDAARDWGERALALAERCGDDETLVHALNTVGSASLVRGDRPEAWARLQRSLALALERNWSDQAARAYLNLIVHSVVHRRHAQVRQLCEEARDYCEARDFELYVTRLRVRRAWALQETCEWDAAATELQALLAQPGLLAMDRAQCLMQQALLSLRRGRDPAARRYAEGLIAGAHELHPTPWYAPPAPVAAEMAWLLGRPADLLALARRELPAAVAWGEPWRCGQLAVWLRRVDALEAMPPLPVAAPCAAELRGDLAGAAAAWATVGNPYQQGLALLGGDAEQLRQALALFESLGAEPAAALARRRLRELGQAARGRNRATRADPLGLTPRERALVQLLAEGLSDRAIAERWHRSVRTVEHHVAHLLAKLGLQRRSEVAAPARPDTAAGA